MGSTFPGTEDRGHLLRTKDTWFGDRRGLGSGVRLGGWGRWMVCQRGPCADVFVGAAPVPYPRAPACESCPGSARAPGAHTGLPAAGAVEQGGRPHGFPPTSLTEVPLTSSKTSAGCWHGPSHHGTSQDLRVARTGSGPVGGGHCLCFPSLCLASGRYLPGPPDHSVPVHSTAAGLGSRIRRGPAPVVRLRDTLGMLLLIPVALASVRVALGSPPSRPGGAGLVSTGTQLATAESPLAIQAIPCPAGVTSKVTARPVSPQTSWGEGLGPPAADAAEESRDGQCWRTRQLPPGHVQQQQILLCLCRLWPRGAPSWAELVPAGGARLWLHMSPAVGPHSCHLLSQVPE
uniref:Uncharacterized protein n=1 Tax=Mustela putorius furo TaxID=9669 RepID=M3Z7W9_MUSPF